MSSWGFLLVIMPVTGTALPFFTLLYLTLHKIHLSHDYCEVEMNYWVFGLCSSPGFLKTTEHWMIDKPQNRVILRVIYHCQNPLEYNKQT
jgi:hypothetical protein